MARSGKDLDSLIREAEAENPGADPDLVTKAVIERMTRSMKQDVVWRWVRAGVWSLRRDKQLAVERKAADEATAHQRAADKVAREAAAAAWEAGQEQREKESYERWQREKEALHADFDTWTEDPSLVPEGWLQAGIRSIWPGEKPTPEDSERERFREWLLYAWGTPGWRSLPEYRRIQENSSSRLLLAACEAHSVPKDQWANVLTKWRFWGDALSVQIALEIEAAAKQIRIELTEELLASEFALGDGVRVTWGSATAEQHRQRADLTTANAVANAQDAARHLAAERMLQEGRAVTLQDLAETERAA